MRPRPQDWPARLAAYLARHADTPFAWGVHDCATFAAGWLVVLGYPDLTAAFRPCYSGPLSAARLMRAGGGYETLVERALASQSCPAVSPVLARRGDVVVLPLDARRRALAIVDGRNAVALTRTGCVTRPTLDAVVAYHV